MGKRGKSSKKDDRNPKRRAPDKDIYPINMDDEIDLFHKQRDVIPLDLNDDTGESDEDNEEPVFDYKDISDDEDDEEADDEVDEEEADDENDEDIDDEIDKDIDISKMKKQLKFMETKMGGVDEETDGEQELEDEENNIWGGKKYLYGDNNISNEDDLAKEEAEALRMQKDKLKKLSMEDFGLEDVSHDASDGERTIEEILVNGKTLSKSLVDKENEDNTLFEVVKKDVNSLSREEQMDVVYSTAPELVGLLSELNDAIEQLVSNVNPLLGKINAGYDANKRAIKYLETKQKILLAYCQAIVFYLLLKAEGHTIRDHPVIGRLVDIKNLMIKIKQLDEYLPSKIDDILKEHHGNEMAAHMENGIALLSHDSITNNNETLSASVGTPEAVEAPQKDVIIKNKVRNNKKQISAQVSWESEHMLKLRASLEEKMKGKGIVANATSKPHKLSNQVLRPINGHLETLDDFDDEILNHGSKLVNISKFVSTKGTKKTQSGGYDFPAGDDVGKRRRKHELRVLARVGIESDEEGDILENKEGENEGFEKKFDRQVKKESALQIHSKVEKYERGDTVEPLPEMLADGKRQISSQIEKNRGLTRSRKKLLKNPRKKYKMKHQKAIVRRKGQVRDVRKPTGPYGGEASGINSRISRSIRFKN